MTHKKHYQTKQQFYNRKFRVIRDKNWKYARTAYEKASLKESEIVVYDGLCNREASIISTCFNTERDTIGKYNTRSVTGLFRLLGMSYGEQREGTVKMHLFNGSYGMGVFINNDIPEDRWDDQVIYVDKSKAKEMVEFIRHMDQSIKNAKLKQCVKKMETVYGHMMEDRARLEQEFGPLDEKVNLDSFLNK